MVTGASRGIGLAISKKLSVRCSNLLITCNRESSLNKGIDSLTQHYDGNIHGLTIDQADPKTAAQKLERWAKATIDHLDAVILSAGIFIEGELCEINYETFSRNMNTNFMFNYLAINSLLELLKGAQNPPRIIIIGSTAAYGSYSIPSYGIAKWALRGYSVNLREELRKHKIGVTFISPGPTLTDMWEGVDLPPKRILDPSDIATIVDSLFDLSEQAVVEELIIQPILGDVDE